MTVHKSRSNFSVDVNGKTEWISRSVVVVPFVVNVVNNKVFMLVEKRGNSVSKTGYYCSPCGYIDYDEDMFQACSREVYEETGVEIKPSKFNFINVNSDPKGDGRQNIGMRFVSYDISEKLPDINNENIITKDEVDEVFWFEIGYVTNGHLCDCINIDCEKVNSLKWAFEHNKIFIECLRKYITMNYNDELTLNFIR